MTFHNFRYAAAITIALCCSQIASAEDDPKIPVIALDKAEGVSFGTVGKVSGACRAKGPTYAVDDFSIFQPVKVVLVAGNPKQKVHLHITKPSGADVIFDGDTNPKGVAIAKFRTQGDMRIVVTSTDPGCHFGLLVWAGATLPPKPRSVLRQIP